MRLLEKGHVWTLECHLSHILLHNLQICGLELLLLQVGQCRLEQVLLAWLRGVDEVLVFHALVEGLALD